ncbi:MAG: SDR family oxidoreductase [Acidobacteriota bacterium]|nr:SDR family oxidoreductase [Acidobacteriota bacterium]
MGKVIVALLLDRIPEIKRLHVLIRPRSDLSAAERFQSEVLESPPLAAIARRAGKEFLSRKLNVVSGDVGEQLCGLTPEEIKLLAGNAPLIINCAGRVDFFPPIDESFRSNVDGVENVIALARRLGAKLLHVSTCFVCGEADGLIEEPVPVRGYYPHRRGAEDLSFDHLEELRRARAMVRMIRESEGGDDPRHSRDLSQRLAALGKQRAADWGWVNTYTYSKSLGEQLIVSAEELDYSIVRPAIVESSWNFPFPGWIEGGRTAAPMVLMALGGLKDWPVREDAPLEVIPVDMVAAAILIVGAALIEGSASAIYQLASADVNPVELGMIVRWLDEVAKKRSPANGNLPGAISFLTALSRMRRGAKIRFVTEGEAHARREKSEAGAERLEKRIRFLMGLLKKLGLPGARSAEDFSAGLRRVALQSRFRDQTLGQYLPFVLQNRYIFECENIRAAVSALSPASKEKLPWRPEAIDWKQYWIKNQIEGIEKWVQPEAVREWMFKI